MDLNETLGIVVPISIFLSLLITNIISRKNIIPIAIMGITCIFLTMLESKFAFRLEKKDPHNVVRIRADEFAKNPHKELKRYVENVFYFTNVWRTALLTACCFTMLITLTLNIPTYLIPYIGLGAYTITYGMFNLKIHHTWDFMGRSLVKAFESLISKEKVIYKQEEHY